MLPRIPARLLLPALISFSSVVVAPAARAASQPTGLWAQLYSPDLKQFAANLRGAGVPEETVGLLISQAVNARFREREQKLQPSVASVQALREGWTAERREELLKLKREKNDLLRSVMVILPEETAKAPVIPDTLVNLTKAQRETVRLIVEDYTEMNARVFTESHGVLLEEDREKLRYLESARDADLAKVLGDEQAVDYQLATDRLMQATLKRLALFQPTPQEVRDIFLVRRKYGFNLALLNPVNPGEQTVLKKKVNAELLERWGPARFAAYQRLGSPMYQPIYYLVLRLGQPAAIADQIYDNQVAVREAPFKLSEEMRARGPMSPRVVVAENGQLPPRPPNPPELAKKMIAEHCAFVKQLLGEAGYKEYYQLNSRWIDAMNEGHMMRIDDSI